MTSLLDELRGLIQGSRERITQSVNRELVLLYWEIGHRIHTEILGQQRADYGQQIIPALAVKLTGEFGKGFQRRNLYRMVQFAQAFPSRQKVSTLSTQLSWSHFLHLLLVKDPLAQDFYAEMCRAERWSVRALRDKIGGMLFERTALSRKPRALIRQELDRLQSEKTVTPAVVFRDPYLLDFLGLQDTFSEKDLEAAILRELEAFLLELGSDFCFIARQKRIIIDDEDFYIDLLFYHRGLRRLVLVELKMDRFRAADKGQVELYLRWLDRYERKPGESSPLGLILCARKGDEQIELLQLESSGIHVAEYLTALPPRELLERRLRAAIDLARTRQVPPLATKE
ncbi:MAG: PDDEXK nuclease domain-containing protein [Myxococcota bacterium]